MQHIQIIIKELLGRSLKPLSKNINIVDEIAKRNNNLKRKVIWNGVKNGSLIINGKVVKTEIISLANTDLIHFLGKKLTIFLPGENKTDQFIQILLREYVKAESLTEMSLDQKNKFVAYFIEYISYTNCPFEKLSQSQNFDDILDLLRGFFKEYLANSNSRKIPEGKDLIDKILLAREEVYTQFQKIINSLKNELYDIEYNKFFKEIRVIFSNQIFCLLAQPITEVEFDYFLFVEKVVGMFKKVEKENDSSLKIKLYVESNKEYESLLQIILGKDIISNGLNEIINYFKEKILSSVGVNNNEEAEISLIIENRSYNFNTDRLLIHGYVINKGLGMAKNVSVSGELTAEIEIPETIISEIAIPDSKRKIKFPINIIGLSLKTFQTVNLRLKLKWVNENDVSFESQVIEIIIEKQQENLPWDEIRSRSPYDLRKIDDPTKLFGRDKLIQDFKFAIEKSASIGSYVIHGQKRVGKSSIVKTLESFYSENLNVHFIYTEVTERKGNDALYTFNEIGRHLSKQLVRDFEKKNPNFINRIIIPAFNGSLSPLIDIIDDIHSFNPLARIILSIDEFDELNEEFFENSNIGYVFASNIGKGLSGKRFVGVILIGSENTENKTKRGMRLLNAVKFLPIDSFSRSDFDEYCKIIKNPTEGLLIFSPEVLEILFEYSNGNPFYTNLICDKIFEEAYEKKISYIDQEFLEPLLNDIQNTLSSKDFVHFWEDGATDDTLTNKKTFSKRCRILLAYAEVKKENGIINWNNLRKKIPRPKDSSMLITDNQFEDTFNEFIHRRIFYLNGENEIIIKPKLFEAWLINNGTFQIASQLEDKEGLINQMQEDEKFKISDEEYSSISNIIFEESGKKEIRLLKDFFEQFENNQERSLIADLLKQVKVLRSSELVAFLKKIYFQIWPSISLGSDEKNYRKDAEVICLRDSFKQNESFYENIIIPQLHLHKSRKLKTREELYKIDEEIRHIIIYEPLLDCPYYYRNELSKILKSINPIFASRLKIHIISFIISKEAKEELENLFSINFCFDVSIHSLKVFERAEFTPYLNRLNGINDQTIKCLIKIYGAINENSCLVKIGELFPYQCFPFLWCSNSSFHPVVPSNYVFENYLNRFNLSDNLKDYYIRSESKKIELKATMATPAVNWKKIKELSKTIRDGKGNSNEEFSENRNAEIQKLWKMDLTPLEKSNAINIVKYSLAKNLSAFANTEGGEIYVGIEDDFTIIGTIEGNNEEDLKRIFTEILKKYIDVAFLEYFSIESLSISENVKISRIEIKECKSDVWITCDEKGNKIKPGEQIFIRSEFGTEKLTPKEYKEWRDQRNLKYRINDQ